MSRDRVKDQALCSADKELSHCLVSEAAVKEPLNSHDPLLFQSLTY